MSRAGDSGGADAQKVESKSSLVRTGCPLGDRTGLALPAFPPGLGETDETQPSVTQGELSGTGEMVRADVSESGRAGGRYAHYVTVIRDRRLRRPGRAGVPGRASVPVPLAKRRRQWYWHRDGGSHGHGKHDCRQSGPPGPGLPPGALLARLRLLGPGSMIRASGCLRVQVAASPRHRRAPSPSGSARCKRQPQPSSPGGLASLRLRLYRGGSPSVAFNSGSLKSPVWFRLTRPPKCFT